MEVYTAPKAEGARAGGLLRGAGAPLNSPDFLILRASISLEKLKEISNFLKNAWKKDAKIVLDFFLYSAILNNFQLALH